GAPRPPNPTRQDEPATNQRKTTGQSVTARPGSRPRWLHGSTQRAGDPRSMALGCSASEPTLVYYTTYDDPMTKTSDELLNRTGRPERCKTVERRGARYIGYKYLVAGQDRWSSRNLLSGGRRPCSHHSPSSRARVRLKSSVPARNARGREDDGMSDERASGGGAKGRAWEPGAAGRGWADETPPKPWPNPADFRPNPTLSRNVKLGEPTQDEELLESPAALQASGHPRFTA